VRCYGFYSRRQPHERAPFDRSDRGRKSVSPRLTSYQKVDGLLATKVLLYLFMGTRCTL
jgi:hypothetical protein